MTATIACWKLTVSLTRTEADAFSGENAILAGFEPAPVFMTSEPDPERPDNWTLDVYTEGPPGKALIAAILDMAPSAGGEFNAVEVVEEDWVTLSQAGLDPVEAGRYFVHTAADSAKLPAGMISLQIEAGLAFGTGQHATTSGCLLEIDALDRQPGNAIDLGTGTAILAIAIAKRWPETFVTASDIDPVAIKVSRENICINGVSEGHDQGQIMLVVADGLENPVLQSRGPYDLIVANILAGPLIDMAPSIAKGLAPGGTLILAGLLTSQADDIEAAYRSVGIIPVTRRVIGEWPALHLRRQ